MWELFDLIFVILTGLVMGSFVTALTYRLPRHLPFSHLPDGRPVRSICPPCGRALRAIELIPVISWILQKGRCQCGKVAIPTRYPLIELGVLAITTLMWQMHGFDLIETPRYVALPFAVAVAILALQGQGWPKTVDHILITAAAFTTLIAWGAHGAGLTGILPLACALPLIAHGARIPPKVQGDIFRLSAPLLVAALITF